MNTQRVRNLLRTTSLIALGMGAATAADAQTVINGGGSSLAFPTYSQEFAQFTKLNPHFSFTYADAGSGGGQAGFLNNDCTFGGYQTCSPTFTVDFGASDAFLSSTQVSGYTLAAQDGPLIQLPTFGVPITIPFRNAKLTRGTELALTDAQLCGIFSGKLTNWTQVDRSAAPGTITVVYRADSSGTSFLFSQHLAAVCTPADSSFTGTLAATKTFTSLFANNVPPANFVGASQSSGVAATLLASSSAMAYLSPDYTSIAPKSPNTTTLVVASVVNGVNKVAYQPSVNNTVTGLVHPGKGSTNASPPATKATAANPLNWIPAIPITDSGYSIVGYTTWDVSTCYANATVATGVTNFLKDNYNNATFKALIQNNGFVPVVNSGAARYVTAINNDFLRV